MSKKTQGGQEKNGSRKMAPMGFLSLEDFHRRKLQPGESVSVYVHDLKRLLDQAMPKLDKKARDDLV